jgi:predicted lipid-binding transport protein (Tim44 family)
VARYPITVLLYGFLLLIGATGVADAQSRAPSAVACDNFARNYAQNSSAQGQMLGGAAKGSLLGLGIGALAGGAGVGAAIGAGIGLISGGARRQSTASRMYDVAFRDCMAGRVR